MSVRIMWLGHAAFALEIGAHKILIDPFLTGNPAAIITPDAVEADYVVVSHGHGDHIGDAVAIAQRTGATVISNFEIANWLGQNGVDPAKVRRYLIQPSTNYLHFQFSAKTGHLSIT